MGFFFGSVFFSTCGVLLPAGGGGGGGGGGAAKNVTSFSFLSSDGGRLPNQIAKSTIPTCNSTEITVPRPNALFGAAPRSRTESNILPYCSFCLESFRLPPLPSISGLING